MVVQAAISFILFLPICCDTVLNVLHCRIGHLASVLPIPVCRQHSTAQHGTAQHSTAQHSTAQHSTAQHGTARHSTAQHGTARHSTAQHGTARHSTAQHSTAQHSTAQHGTTQHGTARHSTAQHGTEHRAGARGGTSSQGFRRPQLVPPRNVLQEMGGWGHLMSSPLHALCLPVTNLDHVTAQLQTHSPDDQQLGKRSERHQKQNKQICKYALLPSPSCL